MKRLLLLGGGHAHLAVLESLAASPIAGWGATLVTPFRRQIYSGMLPGWVAGHYPIDDCAIALDALRRRAGVSLCLTSCMRLDLTRNVVHCTDGSEMPFDLLSIDTGPAPALDALPGALEHSLPIRPIEGFVAAWPGVLDRIQGRRDPFHLVVLGAGAAGVELALAIHQHALTQGWDHLRLTVAGSDALPMEGVAHGARRDVLRLFGERGIDWAGECRATGMAAGSILFEQREPLHFDACLTVTGVSAPGWPREAGLATDDRGFIRVGRSLQALQHPQVLAAGDVAAYQDARPKSGVFAVRAGPVLAQNLRALCTGEQPVEWTPQQKALYLISTGDHRAIAAWGRWSWQGAWVWRWKDGIDRRFVGRFGSDSCA